MSMKPLYLSEADVAGLVSIHDAMEALREAFASWSDENTVNLPRQRSPIPNGNFNLMAAAYPQRDVFGFKVYGGPHGGAKYYVSLCRALDGELVSIIEADLFSQLRTGAATGLATQVLARSDAQCVGILGCGKQAWAQLLGVCAVRDIKEVRVFSPSAQSRSTFAAKMGKSFNSRSRQYPIQRPVFWEPML